MLDGGLQPASGPSRWLLVSEFAGYVPEGADPGVEPFDVIGVRGVVLLSVADLFAGYVYATVAVFRRVAGLPLGVMLCASEIVTLRHLLPGRGLRLPDQRMPRPGRPFPGRESPRGPTGTAADCGAGA